MNKQPLRIGFVGLGRVADVHYAALNTCSGRARVTAVCDTRPEAVSARADAWGATGYCELEDMLDNTELDAVVVLLPHHVHLPVLRTLLARRLPVLLEKPVATKMDEAETIAKLTAEADVPVLVGHNGLFHPAYHRILEIVEKGWIGQPLFGSARSLQWLEFKPWDFRLKKEETGGGAWIDCAGHLLYRLDGIFGPIAELTGHSSSRAREEMEGEDTALATVRYAGGAVAQVMVSYGCKLPGYEHDWPHGCEQMMMISGTKGALEYHICPESKIRLFSEIPGVMPDLGSGWLEIAVPESFEVSFDQQMAHFLDCVEGRATPQVTTSDASRLLEDLLRYYDA
jgi:predicted dehydrogenase